MKTFDSGYQSLLCANLLFLDRMDKDTLTQIEQLLTEVQQDIENPDTSYKLRTARQLLSIRKQRNEALDEATDEAISDEEILENLRELGYM